MRPARLKEIIAANVKALREQRDWRQDQLGQMIGRSYQSISQIETAKSLPGLDTLAALATAFGVPIGALLEDNLPVAEGRAALLERAEEVLFDLPDTQLKAAVEILWVLRDGFFRG